MLLILGVMACGLSSSAAQPLSGWFKLVTPHFELYSNSREADARRLLRDLETFRHVASRFLALTNVQRRPALVYYFDTDRQFQAFKPRYGDQPRPVNGFHVTDPLGDALALSRPEKDALARRVLFHEYTHLLTVRQFRDAPLWANEGVAEVFSTLEGARDRFDIGVALTNHVYYLHEHGIMDLPKLLAVGHNSPDYNEQERAGRFYATSWLLAHYLTFGRGGFQTNVLAHYASLCATTTNHLQAFRWAFGTTPEDLQPALEKYLGGGNYTVVRQTYRDLDDARPRRVRLDSAELEYALGRLLQMVHQPGPARSRFEHAVRENPRDPRPLGALALLAWREGDRDLLKRHVDAAMRLGSRDAFIHFLAADLCYQDLSQNSVSENRRRALLEQGRQWVERALQLDPWLAPAHHLLGIYVLAARPDTPRLAMAHVEQALRCDPQYKPAQLTQASLLAAQGDLVNARRVLALLLASPLPPSLREVAGRVASEIENAGTRR